jgi:2-polyprenyl-6-methoxyphenol hydroxylase-like FAD-dependent oxidoreductase
VNLCQDIGVLQTLILPQGDAYTISPSALRAFKSYPGMPELNDEISYDPWLVYHKHSGEKMTPPINVFRESQHSDAPARMHRHLRPRFQNMLLDYLAKAGIQIEWNKQVVEYFEDRDSGKAGVLLSNNERLSSELVIAADGVGTKSYKIVTGSQTPAQSSGYSLYRSAFPLKYVDGNDILLKRFPEFEEGKRILETWTGFV